MMSAKTDQDALADICCMHIEMDAILEFMFEAIERIGGDSRRRGIAQGMAMALKRINDEVGRRAGAI